jgi:hypothetical protein
VKRISSGWACNAGSRQSVGRIRVRMMRR